MNSPFFDIQSIEKQADAVCCHLLLLPQSALYQAHFKGNPITPAAGMLYMAAQCFSQAMGQEFEVFGVKNAKFVALLQPNQHPQVSLAFSQIEATSTGYKAMLQVVSAQTVFAKMTLFLQPVTA